MRVQVYKNLTRGDWSITAAPRGAATKGRVIGHAAEVVILNARFHVGESSRQRMLKGNFREVHAWVVGDLLEGPAPEGKRIPITYRPFEGGTFVRRDTGAPVLSARAVHFTAREGAVVIE